MYDRAPRPTANYLVGSTKDNVGPGTYDVPLPRYAQISKCMQTTQQLYISKGTILPVTIGTTIGDLH